MATLSILKEPIFGVLIGRLWRTESVFFEPYEWGLLGAHIQISPVSIALLTLEVFRSLKTIPHHVIFTYFYVCFYVYFRLGWVK